MVSKVRLLLKQTNHRNYILFTLGINTGLRAGDLVLLKVKDVQGTHITIRESKTGKVKTIKLSNDVRKELKEYTKGMQGNDWLFKSRQGGNHISVRTVQRVVKWATNALNIAGNYSSHTLRKTFAYHLYLATKKDIAIVMMALNHSSERITLKYLGLDAEALDQAVDSLCW